MRPSVSIVAISCSSSRAEEIRAKLLLDALVPNEAEFIFVSGDRSAAANRNLGIRQAKGVYTVLVDDDIAPRDAQWWKRLVAPLGADTEIACAGPRIALPSGPLRPLGLGSPHPTVSQWWMQHHWYLPKIPDHISTACLACRTAEAQKVRFDERFRGSGFEDVDFSIGLRRQGSERGGIVVLDVVCTHRNERKGRRGMHGENWEEQNYVLLWEKWGPFMSEAGIKRVERL